MPITNFLLLVFNIGWLKNELNGLIFHVKVVTNFKIGVGHVKNGAKIQSRLVISMQR